MVLFESMPATGLWQWLEEHSELFGWSLGVSLGSLAITAALLPWIVLRLPFDYFVASRRELREGASPGRLLARLGRNMLGGIFVIAGIAMLFLPGQGLLTLLIGLLLVDFPGKRGLELRIVRRRGMLTFLNRMRERRGRPPFVVD